MEPIFGLLQGQSGTDFLRYKRSTIQRGLARRMALRQISELAQYTELLRKDACEVRALAQDFLIRVTSFSVIPAPLKVWRTRFSPLCSKTALPRTHYESGSPAALRAKRLIPSRLSCWNISAIVPTSTRIQIFATDLSDVAIEKARTGVYTDSIAEEVSSERLRRFFVKLGEHYQISKTIRDLCVFARQDVMRDPPFSRLDMVSCRNLLIYLDQTLQRQVIRLFHFSLKPNGFLLLL